MSAYESYSKHAECRAQQRRIDPLIDRWLDELGEESYEGFGGIRTHFSKKSIRRMEKVYGRRPVRQLSDKLKVYRIESTKSGQVITIGYRNKAMLGS